MKRFTRRDSIKLGAGMVAGAALLGSGRAFAQFATGEVTPPDLPIEDGASLRVLRPSKFVEGDEVLFLENTKKFTEATGVEVRVDSESWEDLRPKTAVAANVGSGPDIVLAWSDDPHQFQTQTLDLTDIATYLGQKYGGWYPLAEKYGTNAEGRWIAMPIGASGGRFCYRKSLVNEAGYDAIPQDLDGFLQLARKLQESGRPIGLALGNAVGDANAWCNWVVWTHGGAMVDEEDNVIINSPETIAALRYAKALYDTFVPGTLSWLDPSNNKAYLAGEVSGTQNGISIYYVAKNSDDPAVRAIAEDLHHARPPVGPIGEPTETALIVNPMIFSHTKYPEAAKAYLLHLFEQEQYVPWQEACIGYWQHTLRAYDALPFWTSDETLTPFRDIPKNLKPYFWKGQPGYASAAVLADYVVVNMFASVCSGDATPQEAAAEAQSRAERYYKA